MASAVGAIANNRTTWDSIKAIGNTYLNFTFGCGQDTKFTKAIFGKGEYKDKKLGMKDAWHDAGLGESYWGQLKKAFSRDGMSKEWEALGKSGNGPIKKGFEFFSHRMPFLMNAVFLAMEVPNLYKSFTDTEHGGGAGTGVTEIVKTGAKMTAMAAGAAIGSAFVPWLGGLIGGLAGGFVGNFIADKALGARFSDKVKEAEQTKQSKKSPQLQQAQQAAQPQIQQMLQQPFQPSGIPNMTGSPLLSNLYKGQSGLPSRNSIFQVDWKDKDIMAMGIGLV